MMTSKTGREVKPSWLRTNLFLKVYFMDVAFGDYCHFALFICAQLEHG